MEKERCSRPAILRIGAASLSFSIQTCSVAAKPARHAIPINPMLLGTKGVWKLSDFLFVP